MQRSSIILFICFLYTSASFCQNVGIGTTTPAGSAVLDVTSTTKGALVPRMTSIQRNAISNPAAGLLVFDTVEKTLYMFDGQQWLGFPALTDFQRPATNWEYGPDNLQDTTLTGYSVSMWDQFAAVGAPYRKTNGVSTGAVYLYKLIGSNWQYFSTLLPTGNNSQSNFGLSVSIKGNYLIVGAPNHKNGINNIVGAAYIYNFNGTAWVPFQTMFGTVVNNGFGQTVAVNQFGTYIAVSEPSATVGALVNCGIVKVYYKPAATFSFQQNLQDLNPAAGEQFGTTLAMSALGGHIAVGAPSKTVSGFYGNGYAGQFDRNGSSWSQTHTYTPISEQSLGIGTNVDISDNAFAFTVALKKELHFQNLAAQGYTINFTENINSISLDPVTDYFNVFAGSSLYYSSGGSNTNKLITLSSDSFYSLPNLLSVYNSKMVAGLPYNQNLKKPFVGAVYFSK